MAAFPENEWPETAWVRRNTHGRPALDPEALVDSALAPLRERLAARPGAGVALCVGSRGIRDIGRIAARVAEFLRELGLSPFLVPAMGSHGGASPEGQAGVLERLGVTAALPGVPVRAGMEVRELGRLSSGFPVLFSEAALSADFIVVINRVKPHTKFSLPVESGLLKMLAVGLGKARGAAAIHRAAVTQGFGIIEEAARLILERAPVLFGLALLEDGGGLCEAHALLPGEMISREKELLKRAYALLPRLPFTSLDVLVVDEMGKDISGIGMDSKVTGRHRDLTGDFRLPPDPRRIVVLGLSPGSAGNANGIGLADFTTDRLAAAIDHEATYKNAMAALSPEKAAVPMHFPTDREALSAALSTCGRENPRDARMVRIKNTGSLSLFEASRSLAAEIEAAEGLALVSDWARLAFDPAGNLLPPPEI